MKTLLVMISMAFIVSRAYALECTATVYELDSQQTKPLFSVLFHADDESKPTALIHSVHRTLQGEDSTIEDVTLNQGELKEYTLQRKQQGEVLKLSVGDKKITFSKTAEGKTQTSEEDRPKNLTVGLTVVPFIRKNWNDLMAGKSIDIRFASVDRLETVGFKLKKINDDHLAKDQAMIEMSATSFFIAAIVKPLRFTLETTGEKHLVRFTGRPIVRRQTGSKFSDLDAETVYQCH